MTNVLEGLISREDIAAIAQSENLNFNDEDRISILEAMRSIDIQACPGSGKTTLIAAKLILLAKKWPLSHQGICVLSHTNVAKDEIIERLKKSKTPEAQRLLSYPHFIGTIQEFAGKYVAFPYLRSEGININNVDTDMCIDLIYSKISHNTRLYIDRKSQFKNVLYDFDIKYAGEELLIHVPTFGNNHTSKSYRNLHAARLQLILDGYLFYRDVFTFAQIALSENVIVPAALRKKFPCVFLDEMQDTQKFQDELLSEIFPLDCPEINIQRFGDPDQAIFHGIENEEPNSSFNGKMGEDMDFVVHKSHRFDARLASKIRPLSHNEVPLETELSDNALADRLMVNSRGENFQHCVIVFSDDSIKNVIQEFADIVSSQFGVEYKRADKFLVKVVGAVGNEIDPEKEQLKIGHYWQDYDKSKSKSNFKERSLIDGVYYCRQSSSVNWESSYSLLLKCVLTFLRLANTKYDDDKYFSATSLKLFLKEKNEWGNFRKAMHLMLDDTYKIDQVFWCGICDVLESIFNLQNISVDATQYIAFSEDEIVIGADGDKDRKKGEVLISLAENKIMHPDGFVIELSTIHGVKGETHDATLILETKNYNFDILAMLPHFTGVRPSDDALNQALKNKPTNVRDPLKMANKQFLRQLYVAASRPRHLLSLAIHSDHIEEVQKDALTALGWKVILLDVAENE